MKGNFANITDELSLTLSQIYRKSDVAVVFRTRFIVKKKSKRGQIPQSMFIYKFNLCSETRKRVIFVRELLSPQTCSGDRTAFAWFHSLYLNKIVLGDKLLSILITVVTVSLFSTMQYNIFVFSSRDTSQSLKFKFRG